jgi:predicted dehydrogenase
MYAVKKFYRFYLLYGLRRTLFKVAGRSNLNSFFAFVMRNYIKLTVRKKVVSVIGCGQFSFATVGAILSKNKIGVLSCYDVNEKKMERFSNIYQAKKIKVTNDINLINKPSVIYIASNHASHTDYAGKLIQQGFDVFIEKPISVNWKQFNELFSLINKSSQKVFVGYNRPFSKAINKIYSMLGEKDLSEPLSLNCFISGHKIPPTHWYRHPKEGTRVCGNLGHWLDLFVHCVTKRGFFPDLISIQIMCSNINNPDDDFVVTLKTDYGDICTIMLTARSEPFEGINETINFQQSNLIAKIDDFKSLVVWKGSKKYKDRYRIKDPGHIKAIMQPFDKACNWKCRLKEVKYSTFLMLVIKDMVLANQQSKLVDIKLHSKSKFEGSLNV